MVAKKVSPSKGKKVVMSPLPTKGIVQTPASKAANPAAMTAKAARRKAGGK